NVVSTIFGLPLAWLVAGARVLWPPDEDFVWDLPLTILFLLVPSCLASVWIEAMILRCGFKGIARDRVTSAAWRINLCSYGLLFAGCTVWFLLALALR